MSEHEFMEMLHQCRGVLLKVCMAFTDRKTESIRDLYQDIVYNLWLGYPEFQGRSSVKTWAFGVAMNTVKMRHRYRKRQPRFVEWDEVQLERVADTGGDPMVEDLYRLIDRLDEKDRELLLLYLDGVPQKDIAQIFHRTETVINQKISRLKKKLKRMHEDEE